MVEAKSEIHNFFGFWGFPSKTAVLNACRISMSGFVLGHFLGRPLQKVMNFSSFSTTIEICLSVLAAEPAISALGKCDIEASKPGFYESEGVFTCSGP